MIGWKYLLLVALAVVLPALAAGAEETLRTNPIDGAEMIYVAPGAYLAGLSPEQIAPLLGEHADWNPTWFTRFGPQRPISIGGYWMYKHEVTVGQYRKFCEATGRKMPAEPPWGWQDKHPIVNVRWLDAAAYARWADGRLPTEYEWEKAARGTDGRLFIWGNEWEDKIVDLDRKETYPVGSNTLDKSPYGCMDMAGNAWEWCADWWESSSYRNPVDHPTSFYRVIRGGCWDQYQIAGLTCYSKYADQSKQVFPLLGFRIVVDGDDTETEDSSPKEK